MERKTPPPGYVCHRCNTAGMSVRFGGYVCYFVDYGFDTMFIACVLSICFSDSGHFIQHCPTNGDPNYNIKRPKPPTGIPKSMLMATPDGSLTLASGVVAVLKPNEYVVAKLTLDMLSYATFSRKLV